MSTSVSAPKLARLVTIATMLLVIFNLALFAIRSSSLIGAWRYVQTEGAEGTNIYALWRLLEGLPPQRARKVTSEVNAMLHEFIRKAKETP